MTAAVSNYLIEAKAVRVRGRVRVTLYECQGGQWILIRRDISRRTAAAFGFNLDSPAVQAVFECERTG